MRRKKVIKYYYFYCFSEWPLVNRNSLSQLLHLKLQHTICANNFYDHFCELISKEPQLYSSKEALTDCQITA